MNAISSITSPYSSFAMWSAPTEFGDVETDLGPMDAYDVSGTLPEPSALTSLDAGDQFAPVPMDGPEAESIPEPASVEEERFSPQAADINGEMWFFSAGSGCADGSAGDWGGLAGLD